MIASEPQRWLDKATEDVTVARVMIAEGFTSHACFHAQQCIEKAFKAYLIAESNTYPRIHALLDLLKECAALDSSFLQFLPESSIVDKYYISTRYPSGIPGSVLTRPSQKEAEEAVTAAEKILDFVKQEITQSGSAEN